MEYSYQKNVYVSQIILDSNVNAMKHVVNAVEVPTKNAHNAEKD
jgi:hypothetical protein